MIGFCAHVQALQVFTWLQRVAFGCMAVAALTNSAAVSTGQGPSSVWISINATAALSAFAAWRLQRRKFLFCDYILAES